jgi:hypothetical protein
MMNVALITKSKTQINLKLFDEHLKQITEEEFEDVYTLNFFLQTVPKKYNISKTLIIFNDLQKIIGNTDHNSNGIINNQPDNIKLSLADEENTYFINDFNDIENN